MLLVRAASSCWYASVLQAQTLIGSQLTLWHMSGLSHESNLFGCISAAGKSLTCTCLCICYDDVMTTNALLVTAMLSSQAGYEKTMHVRDLNASCDRDDVTMLMHGILNPLGCLPQ